MKLIYWLSRLCLSLLLFSLLLAPSWCKEEESWSLGQPERISTEPLGVLSRRDIEKPSVFPPGWSDTEPGVWAVQKDGTSPEGRLYLFEKMATWRQSELPAGPHWKPMSPNPFGIAPLAAVPTGQSFVFVFFEDGRIGSYHTITNVWSDAGRVDPSLLSGGVLFKNGKFLFPGTRDEATGTIMAVALPVAKTNFISPDYTVFVVYMLVLVFIGWYCSKRDKTSADFFVGGRRIPWWAVALSLMATQVSSIGFMSIPAKSYMSDWSYFVSVGVWFLVVPIVTRYFIPFFRKLNITSAYEYLEFRFHLVIRLFAMLLYSMLQLGRMAIVLYLPALAFSTVTNLDPVTCIITMGVLCTVYTVLGGIEAVIWTDVVQGVVMIGGVILCVITVIVQPEVGPVRLVEVALSDDKFKLGDFRLDWTTTCFWVLLIGNFFTRLGGLTSDQAIVQRYLTTTSDATARKSLWCDVFISIPWAFLVFMLGTALYVFYKLHPGLLDPAMGNDAIVPFYIAQQITFPGGAGLLIAGIFAAAMSSLDSSMHSVATIWVVDGIVRFRPGISDKSRLNLARIFTILLGVFGTGSAVWMAFCDIMSIWDKFWAVTGLFVGGLSGLFILGMFFRRANTFGAILGVVCSSLILWYVTTYTALSFFLYPAIGCCTCVIIGYFASFLYGTNYTTRKGEQS